MNSDEIQQWIIRLEKVSAGQNIDNLPVARPTTKPEQAPDIETLPWIASVKTQIIQAPAAAVFVFVMATAAIPVQQNVTCFNGYFDFL